MTTPLARESDVLHRIAEKAERDPEFSPRDLEVLHEVIRAFEGWQAFGRVAKMLIVTLGIIAAGLAAWDTVLAKLRALVGSP